MLLSRMTKITILTLFFLFSGIRLSFGVEDMPMKKAPMIRVMAKAVVDEDRILMRNIATFEGLSREREKEIGELFIARAPDPGKEKSFSGRFVQKMLSAHAKQAAASIPSRIVIERSADYLEKDKITRLFQIAAGRQLNLSPEKIEIDRLSFKENIPVPSGFTKAHVEFLPGARVGGLTTAKLVVEEDGNHFRDIYLTGDVKIRGVRVRIINPVKRGERITENDVELVETFITDTPSNGVAALDEVIGMEATRNLRKDDWLTTRMFDQPVLIERNQLVTIVVKTPRLKISTKGIALEKGRAHQTIKVKNTRSEKMIYAKVISPDEVRVSF